MICVILRGSKNEKIIQSGLDNQTTYGIMSDHSEKKIRDIIDCLEANGFISVSGTEYPVIMTTDKASDIIYGKASISMKMAKPKISVKKKTGKSGSKEIKQTASDPELLAELKKLRKKLAEEKGVPPYVIFADSALSDMCSKHPVTPEEFLSVSGVGNTKLRLYGESFMNVIKQYHEYELENKPGIEKTGDKKSSYQYETTTYIMEWLKNKGI